MGIIADLVGGFTSLAQQSQANNAAQQDTNALNQLYKTQSGADNSLLQQYFGSGQGSGMNALNGVTGQLSGLTGQNMSNPYSQQATGANQQLQNYNGLKPQELAALQTSTGNSNMSMINTLRGQMGGTANPGSTIQGLTGQAMQGNMNQGIQLGSLAAGQELSGLQSAAGNYGSLSGQNNSYMDMIYQNMLGATGQQGNLLGQAFGGINQMADTYSGAAQGAAKTAQQDGQNALNGFAQFGNSAANLFMPGSGLAGLG